KCLLLNLNSDDKTTKAPPHVDKKKTPLEYAQDIETEYADDEMDETMYSQLQLYQWTPASLSSFNVIHSAGGIHIVNDEVDVARWLAVRDEWSRHHVSAARLHTHTRVSLTLDKFCKTAAGGDDHN